VNHFNICSITLVATAALTLFACGTTDSRTARDDGSGGSAGSESGTGGKKAGGTGGKATGGTGGKITGGTGGTAGASGGSGGTGTGGTGTGGSGTGGTVATGGSPGTGGVDPLPVMRTSYNFETDIESWSTSSLQRNQVGIDFAVSAAQAASGTNALAVMVDTNGKDFTDATKVGASYFVGVVSPADFVLKGGQVVTYEVFVPADAPILGVQPFLMTTDRLKWNWFGTFIDGPNVKRGEWVSITVKYPDNIEEFWEIGVQFIFNDVWKGSVYVDNVIWK
jgi:hypothetical protein